MKHPKRYSPFYTLRNGDGGLASFGVESRDNGIYVEHSEYWKLFEEVTRLKAEVEELKALTSEMDSTINVSQAACREYKAEVERLTALKDACKRMIKRRDKWIYEHRSIRKQLEAEIERLKSLCDCLGMGGKHTITELEAENARLKAEVERLTAFTTRTIIPNEQLQAENARLKAEVERLRLIGDEINMWGVVAPYVVPPCIDKYSAKEGKQP